MLKALIPAALVLAGAAIAEAQTSSTSSKQVHRTLALDRAGQVRVETYKGSVKIAAWDRPEVEVSAEVVADDGCGDATYQAEMVRDTEVRIEGGGDSLRIESDYDKARDHNFWRNFPFGSCSSLPNVHYTISMPSTAKLDLKDYKSSLEIAGLQAQVRISTYKGDSRIKGLAGPLRFDTYKGDARVAFDRLSGDSSFKTHKGDIEITLPKDTRFAVNAEVGRRGRMESDFPVVTRTRGHRNERVEGSVNGGGPEIALETSRGSFRLRSF